ncbi:TetR/AcrR family transcriptional regulator, partial [Pseudorhodoplanes sp.]|uniref:TetR/AcrR family transcriptional regulator n=1 Tax=Pseudorhodoplanes sp. TaxID=1934341 RepID=UPI003D0D9982
MLVMKVPGMAAKKVRRAQKTAGRRREGGLTRALVVAEARLLNEQGEGALSMRVLAKRLGVSTMALYNHVSDKQDLMAGIAQAVVEELRIPAMTGNWQERLCAIFRALRQICLANPHAIPVIEKAQVLPAIFRPMEAALGALQDAGIRQQDGLRAYFMLTNFTLGQVSYEIRGPFRGLDPAEAVRTRAIDAAEFPLVVSAVTAGDWDFDAAFEFGLDTII